MTTMMMNAAMELVLNGWSVLPLNGKVPLTANGFHDATEEAETIAAWWTRWPRANVGIAVPEHLMVLDVDPRHDGHRTLSGLEAVHGELPATLVARSGRGDGGRHLWFRRPAGELTGCKLAGIDLKLGGRGYVVAPPSIHPESGKPYEWLSDDPVAFLPSWLLDLVRVQVPAPRCPGSLPTTTGSALVRFVSSLPEGNRNQGLYWAGRRALEDGVLHLIHDELLDAAIAIGLPEREAKATLASAGKAGA